MKTTKNITMKSKIHNLLDELCVKQGYCLPVHEVNNIVSKKHLFADEFAELVLLAEGMNPETDLEQFRNIKRVFSNLFGNELYETDFD